MKSYVVYQFNCPRCNDSYIGKTECNLCTRTEKHACSDKQSAIYDHINNCSCYGYINSPHDWNILLIKEAFLIKQKMPKLNNGLKASKNIRLFN